MIVAESKWTEGRIASVIATQVLARKCVVLVDRCKWTGHECDVLAVTKDLRVIDIEIKISRADLKADAEKDKWWRHLQYLEAKAAGIFDPDKDRWDPWKHRQPRRWPAKVWKHYYALPAEIWKPDLIDCLPSPASGVILLKRVQHFHNSVPYEIASVERRAHPNKDAARLTPEQVIDVARLANLRMWNAYDQLGAPA